MSPCITKAHVSCWLDFQGDNYIAQALLIPLPRGSNHGCWACQVEGIIRYLVPDTAPLWFSLQTVFLAFNYCVFTCFPGESSNCLNLTVTYLIWTADVLTSAFAVPPSGGWDECSWCSPTISEFESQRWLESIFFFTMNISIPKMIALNTWISA